MSDAIRADRSQWSMVFRFAIAALLLYGPTGHGHVEAARVVVLQAMLYDLWGFRDRWRLGVVAAVGVLSGYTPNVLPEWGMMAQAMRLLAFLCAGVGPRFGAVYAARTADMLRRMWIGAMCLLSVFLAAWIVYRIPMMR